MTTSNEEAFGVWAPDDSPWSAWAKPVLFSQATDAWRRRAPDPGSPGSLPEFDQGCALVVDLLGVEAVRAGLQLAARGWRPIPLFNATTGMNAVVDVDPLMEALLGAADALATTTVHPTAPPAFLIDARRMTGTPRPGDYDNRSVVLPQDLPSANMLRSKGISRVTLVLMDLSEPREDLRHVLLRWQQGGIELRQRSLQGQERPLVVTPPSLFRKAWYRLVVLFGLRRSNVGGFGGMVPEETSGGGFG
jgi:hypothetical protein